MYRETKGTIEALIKQMRIICQQDCGQCPYKGRRI